MDLIKSVQTRVKNISREFFRFVNPIGVYALVGGSGTGKSFRARLVAEKHKIRYIIDDGLLICEDRIVAGRSAKKAKYYITAIKVALFDDESHREKMVEAIRRENVESILLIGTSDKMVEKVRGRLHLPEFKQIIRIDDVSTEQEIEEARKNRQKHGRHVIPVPAIEVKRDYSAIFSDTIRVFFSGFGHKKNGYFEKAVVKPDFHFNRKKESKRGSVKLAETALIQMIQHCVEEYDHHYSNNKIKIISTAKGYRLNLHITIPFGVNVIVKIEELREYVIESIERYTGIQIEELEIDVDEIGDPSDA